MGGISDGDGGAEGVRGVEGAGCGMISVEC